MSQPEPPKPPAGWYPDPSGAPGPRYFDGTSWTENRPSNGPAEADSGGAISELPKWQKRVLMLTLLLNSFAAFCLAVLDLRLATDPLGLILTATLAAIGLINVWSLYPVHKTSSSWRIQVIVAQVLVVVLIVYIGATALRMPWSFPWWGWCVLGACGLLLAAALAWIGRVVALGRFSEFHWTNWTKTAAAILALVPLGGFISFWWKSDYLPKVTAPVVEISAELTPIGFQPSPPAAEKNSVMRLSAKVTFHNRGAGKVYIAGALMRVTAYRYNAGPDPAPDPKPEDVQQQLRPWTDADNVFRASPIWPAQATLLYAEDLAGYPGDTNSLDPGAILTNQREVDISVKDVRLVRLSTHAVIFTDRQIRHVGDPYLDQHNPANTDIQYTLAPRSAIQEIISGDPVLKVQFQMKDPSATNDASATQHPAEHEYPRLDYWMCANETIRRGQSKGKSCESGADDKTASDNPVNSYETWAEYAPTDQK